MKKCEGNGSHLSGNSRWKTWQSLKLTSNSITCQLSAFKCQKFDSTVVFKKKKNNSKLDCASVALHSMRQSLTSNDGQAMTVLSHQVASIFLARATFFKPKTYFQFYYHYIRIILSNLHSIICNI